MTMKPANLSLLKLSSISSRCLLRRSGQVEGRSFVTIFNPAAPKLKRLQRSPGFEAQTPPAESEKVSMLRKALEEAKIELEDVKTEAPTSSLNGIEKTVHVTKDSSVRENITKPVKHESESVDITEEKKDFSISADDSKNAPNSDVTTPQKDTCEDTKKVQTEIADSESRESREANCFVQGKKKKLKPIRSTSNTDHTEDDDSSSSSSDSGTSSSSSDSSSDDEAEEKKPVKSARLNQELFLDLSQLSHVKPHTPMIKFRKGRASGSLEMPNQSVNSPAKRDPVLEIESQDISSTVLEWWEKPGKYCRENLDETEIEQINSGGASRLYQ